jgi:hypothetical protein
MRHYVRWGTLLGALGGFAFWFRRYRRAKRINPHSLGSVSEQWFSDRRHEL